MRKKLQSIILACIMAFTMAIAPVNSILTDNSNVTVVEAAKKKTIKTFTINSLYNTYSKVTGKGLKNATVKAYAKGKLIGSSKVRSNGTYSISIPKQPAGRTVTVKISKSGYTTRSKSVTVKKDKASSTYVYCNGGNSKSKIYHKTAHAHNMEGAIKMTKSQAKAKGYRACKRCW